VKAIRQMTALVVVMMVLCIMPCLLPGEISENVAQNECDVPVRAQQNGDRVTDISACQNGCRMRYGPAPPMGQSIVERRGAEGRKDPGMTPQMNSPTLYLQCMEECERNYWQQFEEDTGGSRRRR
jgi:hypothetical protein